MADYQKRDVYGNLITDPDDRPSVGMEYAREVLNKPRGWVPQSAEIATERLRDTPLAKAGDKVIAASPIGDESHNVFKASHPFAQKVADKVLAAQSRSDGQAGWVEKASKAALKATNQARHATGADKYDGTPEGESRLAATKNWHASVADLMAADEERQAREAHAGEFVEHAHGMAPEAATAGGESGPTEDIYGRTHNIVQRYGDNFYPQARPGSGAAPAPPGGETYDPKTGEYQTIPRAPQESPPAEELPPPMPPAPASTEMLKNIRPVSFDYKPGEGAPGRNYGVLAQDLEKSPMGASLVQPDARGVKTVNVGKAAMANLAATADLHQRVSALEGGVDKDAQKRMHAEEEHAALSKDAYASVPPQTVTSDARAKQHVHTAGYEKGLQDAAQQMRGNLDGQLGTPVMAQPSAPMGMRPAPMPMQLTMPAMAQHAPAQAQMARPAMYTGTDVRADGVDRPYVPDMRSNAAAHEQAALMARDAEVVASDEVVKDDIQREGISPQEAYASRVNELTAMAQAGHPEAPRKLERLEREGSAVGLADTQNPAPAGNLIADGRPTVAEQYARKVYKSTIGRTPTPPEPGSQEANIRDAVNGKDTTYGDTTPPPFERVPESTGLAGEDKTLKGEAPAPKVSDAAAEPEQGPPPAQPPAYSTIEAHYQDQIGPEAWKALSESERAAFTAADAIHNRMRGQAANDTAVAKAQTDEASARGVLALHEQRMVEARGTDLEQQARDIQADASALADYHENPNHFWQTRSTAQTVAGFIGIALGGFVQGVRGGENVALKQINHAIDRDIDAQRANFQAKKDSVAVKRSAYGMAMERYNHDDNKASTAVRLAMLDRVDAQARVAAAQHAGTDTDNRLDMFLGDTAKVRADQIIAYKKYIQKQTVANGTSMDTLQKEFGKYYSAVTEKGEQPMQFAQWAHGRMGGQVPGSNWGASTDRKNAAAEKQAEADQKRTIIVDGKPRLAVNTEVVKEWNDYSHVSAEARRLYNVMQASKNGDPAAFDAAQAKLVEIMPAVFGFARGPSVAQVQHTLGPAAIPNYAHWYQASLSSRVDTKLEDLGKSLDTLDKSTREHTLAQTGTATIAPQGGGDTSTPKTFKEAK